MVHLVKDKPDLVAQLEAAGSRLVVIDFYATWCGPCKVISPVLDKMSIELKDEVVFLKVDVDETDDIAADYKIEAMPTFVFIKNKAEVGKFSGASETKLRENIDKLK